jgi:alcohol dehydrogenase (cytochrome c)
MTGNKARLLLGVAGLVALWGVAPAHAQLADFEPVTDAILNNPDPEDWIKWRRHNANGYSPLDQINKDNVGDLRLAWTTMINPGTNEQEPLVYDGIMFLPHPGNIVQALDAKDGTLIWEYRRELADDPSTNRNIALYEDKVILTGQDSAVVALDARTGSVVWETQVVPVSGGMDYSSGPVAGGGKIFAGSTCGSAVCFLAGFDAESGEELWRRLSIAGPDDPEAINASWSGVPFDAREKASLWLSGSYDPELNIIYWTTASSIPYPAFLRGTEGPALYTNSILAVNADTGDIVWYQQMSINDNYDMDHMDNPVLAEIEVDGTTHKAVFVIGKPGVLWAFDRETGEHLWNRQIVQENNLYESIDPDTGEIVMNPDVIPTAFGQVFRVCPGMRGGKLFQTKSYDPVEQRIFVTVSNACHMFEIIPPEVNRRGIDWDTLAHMEGNDGMVGRMSAVNAETGEILWTYDQRAAMGSSVATAGGIVFAADLHRYFRAHDAETGEILWEVPLSSPVAGYPISYGVDGKQYVAVAVGGSTSGTEALATLYPEIPIQNGSNVLMVFALDD